MCVTTHSGIIWTVEDNHCTCSQPDMQAMSVCNAAAWGVALQLFQCLKLISGTTSKLFFPAHPGSGGHFSCHAIWSVSWLQSRRGATCCLFLSQGGLFAVRADASGLVACTPLFRRASCAGSACALAMSPISISRRAACVTRPTSPSVPSSETLKTLPSLCPGFFVRHASTCRGCQASGINLF